MKAFFGFLLVTALLIAALFVPIGGRSFSARANQHGIPAAIARHTAHGLRAVWDRLASLSGPTAAAPAPAKPARKTALAGRHPATNAAAANAAAVNTGASREGIVAQRPKEKLESSDRDALNSLIAHAK